jgi:hypothetical protein
MAIDVAVTLVGADFSEDGGVFTIDEYIGYKHVLQRFSEMTTILLRVRPEINEVVFRADNFTIHKTVGDIKADIELAKQAKYDPNKNG